MKFARIIEGENGSQLLLQKRYADKDDEFKIILTAGKDDLQLDLTIDGLTEDKASELLEGFTEYEIISIFKNVGVEL